MNRAILDALRDGAEAFDARGLLTITLLEATGDVGPVEPALSSAAYTIVRALPLRAARGTLVHIATRDLGESEVELVWETWEDPSLVKPSGGPVADLLQVAFLALEDVCRASMGVLEQQEGAVEVTSSAFQRGARIRRRVRAVVPRGAAPRAP